MSPKYCGPFQVEERIGQVAYKLKLRTNTRIHNVVHVSQLKTFHEDPPVTSTIPDDLVKSTIVNSLDPELILDHRIAKVNNAVEVQYLVRWKGTIETKDSWEPAESFYQKFPSMVNSYLQT